MPRPRHAAALSYDEEAGGAPQVVAAGSGIVAERIIALAREHGVPIHDDAGLAEALARLQLEAAGARGAVEGGRRGARVGLPADRAGVGAPPRSRCGRTSPREGPRARRPRLAVRPQERAQTSGPPGEDGEPLASQPPRAPRGRSDDSPPNARRPRIRAGPSREAVSGRDAR